MNLDVVRDVCGGGYMVDVGMVRGYMVQLGSVGKLQAVVR